MPGGQSCHPAIHAPGFSSALLNSLSHVSWLVPTGLWIMALQRSFQSSTVVALRQLDFIFLSGRLTQALLHLSLPVATIIVFV